MSARPPRPLRVFAFDTPWEMPFATSAPFPGKLLTWLRMTGLPHEVVPANDPRKGPTGKSPWIEDGSVRMGDTELILQYLRTTYGADPDAAFSPADRALALAWLRLLEEHYHQVFEWELFLGENGATRLAEFAAMSPWPLRSILPFALAGALRKQLHARGVSRHAPANIVAMGKADLDALEEFLADRPFFLGSDPSTLDASAFAFLGLSIWLPHPGPVFAHARSRPRLVAYCDRMVERLFPEAKGRTFGVPRPGSAR